MEDKDKLVMGVGEKPTPGLWAFLSLQHVVAMFSATILIPMIVGIPTSIALLSLTLTMTA